jgi:hypothetical protein
MTATLNKIINDLIDNTTNFKAADLAEKYPTLTIISAVPSYLEPSVDFSWNGDLLYTGTKAETLKLYGDKPLEELLVGGELKLVWSPDKVELTTRDLFKTGLVIRIRSVVTADDKTTVTYTALRNKWATSSLVEQTIEVKS